MIVEEIAESLQLSEDYIKSLQLKNYKYRIYKIPKKNNGFRTIKQPSKEIKTIQYWINENILIKLPVSNATMAYEEGASIKANAIKHKDSSYVLHMDICDFFPSIKKDIIRQLLLDNNNKLHLTKEDVQYILNLVLFRGEELTIGSVSAPMLSNRIMYKFDVELLEYLSKLDQKYIYTRYADDIIISSKKYINSDIKNVVSNMLSKYNFIVNQSKTYYMNKANKRQITGVIIDNNTNALSVGTKRIRKIKRDIYNLLVKNKDLDHLQFENKRSIIRGELAFIKSISPKQYDNLKKIYTRYETKELKIF